jgi:hypothetical protein
VSRFLDNACPDHHVRGGSDHVRAEHTAMRLLANHPEIATANFYTAMVCGDPQTVTRMLADDPAWVARRNGEASDERAGGGGEGDLDGEGSRAPARSGCTNDLWDKRRQTLDGRASPPAAAATRARDSSTRRDAW